MRGYYRSRDSRVLVALGPRDTARIEQSLVERNFLSGIIGSRILPGQSRRANVRVPVGDGRGGGGREGAG
jgi:hypothetical protein